MSLGIVVWALCMCGVGWGTEATVTAEPSALQRPEAPQPIPASSPSSAGSASAAAANTIQAVSTPDTEAASVKPVPSPTGSAPGEKKPPSDAEQLARLNRSIQSDERRLEELNEELTSPTSEFVLAETEFQDVTRRLQTAKDELARQQKEMPHAPHTELLSQVTSLEKSLDLDRQRLDLAIQTRRTLQEQVTALTEGLRQNRQARAKLTGELPLPPESTVATPTVATPAATEAARTTAPQPEVAVPAASHPAPAPAPAVAASGLEGGAAPAPVTLAPAALAPAAPVSKELKKAKEVASRKDDAAREAEQEVESLQERITNLDHTIDLEHKQYSVARQRSEVAFQQQKALEADFLKKSIGGKTPPVELRELSERAERAGEAFAKARQEFRDHTERLNDLQVQRTAVQSQLIAALGNAKALRQAAETAEQRVSTLNNPFSLNNVLQWLLDHGVKILLIVVVMLGLRAVIATATQRIVALMVRRGARGTKEERADRANTLAGVFHNAGTMTIMVGGTLMICEEVGIAVGPLLGGAAVFGLAIAFGAQNLIRDYFYGFVILLENQYKLNDVLKIGDVAGQVERITLRMTVLRDLEGRVHFIPNGKIDSVTNMTHGWSRALLDVSVAYKEDADHVMGVLMELAAALRRDQKFGPLITDDAEMLGVDQLADSAVTIRFIMKTRPLQQWAVRRELLRRIKRRFDELGIEIPFPHRTIYHRQTQESIEQPQEPSHDWEQRKSA